MTAHRTVWERYQRYRVEDAETGLTLDVSRVAFPDDLFRRLGGRLKAALAAVDALEAGALANADEGRMVGHYWLRAPQRAPSAMLRREIEEAVDAVEDFAGRVLNCGVRGEQGAFRHVIHVGIGGSTLGPQLVHQALGDVRPPLQMHFLDNADPSSVDRVIDEIGDELGTTLVSITSKCGWTPTPCHILSESPVPIRVPWFELRSPRCCDYRRSDPLDERADAEQWLARFPLWDWVGGRTSVTSAVGLLPLALNGANGRAFLAGAAAMDESTRTTDPSKNPAAILAALWFWLGGGRGDRQMVVLPYSDRLALFPRYVQQLVMESIGKRQDRSGAVVHQGLTVFGNKGATDQHSYVQQLREGPNDFFVTFVTVDIERPGGLYELSPDATLGDFLFGCMMRLADSLYEDGRASMAITLPELTPRALGALIALFERAVALYAELINVNAYNQPSIEKDAAAETVRLQKAVLALLRSSDRPQTPQRLALAAGYPMRADVVHRMLVRLAHDPRRGVRRFAGRTPSDDRFDTTSTSERVPVASSARDVVSVEL